jgi:membrane associated rhomboid family serine protease
MESLCAALSGRLAERSIGVPRLYFCLLDIRNCRCLLHGIVACYLLGNGDIVLIGVSGAISAVLGIATGV